MEMANLFTLFIYQDRRIVNSGFQAVVSFHFNISFYIDFFRKSIYNEGITNRLREFTKKESRNEEMAFKVSDWEAIRIMIQKEGVWSIK